MVSARLDRRIRIRGRAGVKPSTPRARCPICGKRKVAVRPDGRLRPHGYQPGNPDDWGCPGGAEPSARRRRYRNQTPTRGVPYAYPMKQENTE